MRYISKEVMAVLRPHIKAGTIRLESGTKHAKVVRCDNNRLITVAGSPSDYRSLLNFRQELNRLLIAPVDYTGDLRCVPRCKAPC